MRLLLERSPREQVLEGRRAVEHQVELVLEVTGLTLQHEDLIVRNVVYPKP